jgi:hypothetical protein
VHLRSKERSAEEVIERSMGSAPDEIVPGRLSELKRPLLVSRDVVLGRRAENGGRGVRRREALLMDIARLVCKSKH